MDLASCLIFFYILNLSYAQISFNGAAFSWQDQGACQPNQFYNSISFSCANCPSGTVSTENHNGCKCAPGQRLANWSYGQLECEACTENWATSHVGLDCVQCINGNNATVPRDLTTGYCPACNPNEIIVDIGSTERCVRCGSRTTPDQQKLECVPCNNAECFCQANPNTCSSTEISPNIPIENLQNFRSSYIQRNLPFARTECEGGNRQQCQQLANLCVLQNYNQEAGSACTFLENIQRTQTGQQITPTLFYYNTQASIELNRENAIDAIFTVEENGTNSYLDIVAASYALNGSFLGMVELNTGLLQVCPTLWTTIKGGYLFGRQFEQTCMPTIDEVLTTVLKNSETHSTIFYELYLRYSDMQGRKMAYPIPIVNQEVKDGPEYVNRYDADRSSRWKLTRRFFLADIQQEENNNSSWLLRVPTFVSLHIQMQPTRDGKIFPPYLIIQYAEFTATPNSNSLMEGTFSSKFSIQYWISSQRHDKTIEVLMAVFCSTSVLWAALYVYSWFRRSGKPMPDISTLIKLVLYECEVISNIFLLVMGCMAVWITFAYKLQKHMVYVLLSYNQEWSFVAYMISALGLKTISLFHTYITLALTQTFFVDWERSTMIMEAHLREDLASEPKKKRKPVVIWRTYLIANEWNELQNYRKTSIAFQLLIVLFTLEFLDFKDYAIIQPGFARGNQPPEYASSRLSRFAVDLVAYMIFGMAQWIAQVLIIERVVDPFRNFMDLCSVANISIVALTHPLRGHYIHGRSVHGLADTDMMEMNTFLKREKDNLCSLRGLENGGELQTFIMNLPLAFRDKYEEITAPLRTPTQNVDVRLTGTDRNTVMIENSAKVYAEINQFFKDLIDHANSEMDYTITDSKLIDDILGLEMRDTTKVGTFTRDPSEMAYSNAFLYGNEWVNMSFEMLLFCVLDMATHSRIFAAAITYLLSTLIRKVAKIFFTNNLIKSSLVDGRFLI